MKVRLAHQVVIAITIPVIFQICFFCLLLRSVEQLDCLERAERDSAEVLLLKNRMTVAEAFSFLYFALYKVAGKQEYKKKLAEIKDMHTNAFKGLNQRWFKDNVKHQILQEQWKFVLGRKLGFMMFLNRPHVMNFKDFFGGSSSAVGMHLIAYDRGNLGRVFDELERSQSRLLKESQEKESEIKYEILAALLASLVVSLAVGFLFSRSIAARLQKVVDNIKALDGHVEELQSVGGNDEISFLNLAVIDTQQKIKAAEQFQAQTASIVAEELDKPLSQINDYLVDLKENGFQELKDNGDERIRRSLLEITRLRSLVKDLTSLDKISRIGWELEYVELDLAGIARAAFDTVHDYAQQSGVELILQTKEARVIGDPARLQQIALNLLTNAIKFSKPNSTIEIDTHVDIQFGKLSVTDHGSGIPEEFQQKIFGHFEQVSRSDATEKGGSGLGLAVSKRLVESQKGRMGFKSQLGSGSTFWFSLPLAQTSSHPQVDYSGQVQADVEPLPIGADKDNSRQLKSPASDETDSAEKKREFKSTLWQKSLVIVLIPLFVQFVTIGVLWNVIGSIRNNVNEFHRFSQIASLHAKLMDALIKGNLMAIIYNVERTDSFKFLTIKERGVAQDAVQMLRTISQSDNVLAKEMNSLDKMVQEQFSLQEEFMRAPQDANVDQFFGPNSREKTERILAQVAIPLDQAMKQEEKLVEKNVLAKTEVRQIVGNIAIVWALCTFIVSVLVGVFIMKELTLRVGKIVDNTNRLTARKPLVPPSGKKDEIGFVEQSFYDAANMLTRLEQYKQELIALTSHEFRTPLASLLAKVDLMDADFFGPLNAHGHSVLARVKHNILDLIALLTNLLEVEKIQSGKSEVVKEVSSLNEILDKAVQNVLAAVKERSIDLTVSGAEVRVDAARIIQSLTAVLTDIAQHAPAGSSIAMAASKQNNELNLTIQAPGGKCSREALNSSTARGRLAVDLLRLVAQQHGGRIEVNAGQDQLLVRVTLPLPA